jgi:hypothetical protein
MGFERVNDKKASIAFLLPTIVFMVGLLSPSDVLDRLWFGSEFREVIEEWAPWTVYRANQSDFSQVALLMGGVCTFLQFPQFIIALCLMDLRRVNGGVMPFFGWLKLVAPMFLMLVLGVCSYLYPEMLEPTRLSRLQAQSRFYAAFIEGGFLLIVPSCAAALIHAFVIYPATVFTFKKK